MILNLLKDELINSYHLSCLIYFKELPSTNKFAKDLPVSNDVLILTDHQTSGNGRFGRKWVSSSGCDLAFSIVKKFDLGIDSLHIVNFYSSYTMILTLSELFGSSSNKFTLKWPNDILLNGKKVCGILLEVQDLNVQVKKFIIGLGVNINSNNFSDEIAKKATSLLASTGKIQSREDILIKFVSNFYKNIKFISQPDKLMVFWKDLTEVIGKKINFKIVEDSEEISAVAENIETDGGLKVKMQNGESKVFYSGEITFVY